LSRRGKKSIAFVDEIGGDFDEIFSPPQGWKNLIFKEKY